ncbi:Tricalbin-2 [Blastocladiella emersonii ATCC 22665]|nr:Tricalbin-2 [Blastocladiella emersonii ATCC 22665]
MDSALDASARSTLLPASSGPASLAPSAPPSADTSVAGSAANTVPRNANVTLSSSSFLESDVAASVASLPPHPAAAQQPPPTTTAVAGVTELPGTYFFDPQPSTRDLPLVVGAEATAATSVPAPVLALGLFNPSEIEALRGSGLLFAVAGGVWLVNLLGAGLSGTLLVALGGVHYYNMSRGKLANKVRLEAEFNASRRRLQLGAEEADWFNTILAKFWLAYEPTLSATIQASLEPILEWVCPTFIDSMKFSHFTLGTFPPQLRNIISARHQPDDIIDFQFDLSLGSFGPRGPTARKASGSRGTSQEDLTGSSASLAGGATASTGAPGGDDGTGDDTPADATNSRIDLVVRIKGISLTVRAENITVEGRMRVRMKLMTAFPHVKVLELWFLEAPRIGFELRPLGSFDVNALGSIRKWLDDTIAWAINTNLVYPVPLVLPFDDWFNNPMLEADKSIGVLVVHVRFAKGLKNADLIGKSDPFARIVVGSNVVGKTNVINNNLNPTWDEIKYVPIGDLKDAGLRLEVFDYDKSAKNKMLGFVEIDLASIDQAKGGKLPVSTFNLTDNERRAGCGSITADISFYPVVIPTDPAVAAAAASAAPAADGSTTAAPAPVAPVVPAPECTSGLLKVTVHAAKNLEGGSKLRSPQTFVAFNGEEVFKSRIKKHSNNPLWEESFEVFVPDFRTAKLHFKVKDDAPIVKLGASDSSLGQVTVSVASALKKDFKDDWYTLADGNSRDAKLRMTMKWRPVPLKNDSAHASIGALRVRVLGCSDLKSSVVMTSSVNPYVRLLTSSKVRAQTRRLTDTANPEFHETLFALVRDVAEPVVLQVWDYSRTRKDALIGTATLDVSKYVTVNPATGAVEPRGSEPDDLRLFHLDHPNKTRGRMSVEVSFHPKETVAAAPAGAVATAPDLAATSPRTCGVLKVNIHQLKDLPRKGNSFVEVFADDPQLCMFRTVTRKKTADPIFEQSCEVFVRNVYATLLKLNVREDATAGNTGPGDGVAAGAVNAAKSLTSTAAAGLVSAVSAGSNSGNASAATGKSHPLVGFLETLVAEPFGDERWYELSSGGRAKLSFEFTPVHCTIDASESHGNVGMLHLEVVGARGLPSTDRLGRSDPFAIVMLNDERWHRTGVQKKTLNPVWKERVKIPIVNRNRSALKVEIFDWDRVGENERIGGAEVNLGEIALDTQQTVEVPLIDAPGFVVLSYRFEPQRMDKVPSRAMTLTRATLDRFDPRRVLGNAKFSSSFRQSGDPTATGSSVSAINTLASSSSANNSRSGLLAGDEAGSPTDPSSSVAAAHMSGPLDDGAGGIDGSLPGSGAGSAENLSRSASTDFGSNSSLNTFVDEHTEKVSERGAVTVTVIEAQDLPAVDRDGMSDPYVKIRLTPTGAAASVTSRTVIKFETRTVSNELNPVWEQTFTSALPKHVLGTDVFTARVAVWDRNRASSDTLIGTFEFNVWDLVHERVHKRRVVHDPRGLGWAYIQQDLWLTLALDPAAVALADKVKRSQSKLNGPSEDDGSEMARPARIRILVAVLVPSKALDRLTGVAPRPLPPGMASATPDDEYWRDQVLFPTSLLGHGHEIGGSPPATAEYRPNGTMGEYLTAANAGGAGGRHRDASNDAASIISSKSSSNKLTSGFKRVFGRGSKDGKHGGSSSAHSSSEGGLHGSSSFMPDH